METRRSTIMWWPYPFIWPYTPNSCVLLPMNSTRYVPSPASPSSIFTLLDSHVLLVWLNGRHVSPSAQNSDRSKPICHVPLHRRLGVILKHRSTSQDNASKPPNRIVSAHASVMPGRSCRSWAIVLSSTLGSRCSHPIKAIAARIPTVDLIHPSCSLLGK